MELRGGTPAPSMPSTGRRVGEGHCAGQRAGWGRSWCPMVGNQHSELARVNYPSAEQLGSRGLVALVGAVAARAGCSRTLPGRGAGASVDRGVVPRGADATGHSGDARRQPCIGRLQVENLAATTTPPGKTVSRSRVASTGSPAASEDATSSLGQSAAQAVTRGADHGMPVGAAWRRLPPSGTEPSSTSACRTHLRSVSAFIPNRPATVRIASYSEE